VEEKREIFYPIDLRKPGEKEEKTISGWPWLAAGAKEYTPAL
jgi:hypothetical protein